MSLETKINQDLVVAMKAKDEIALRSIRAIKSAILLVKTDGSGQAIDEAREVAIVQKLLKSRQDSLEIYEKNGREDLAKIEREEIEIIKRYLPQMLEGAELEAALRAIIAQVGASSAADFGKVMGVASKQLAGKAEGRAISEMVKKLLA
ncbi:MAG: GatB/YqeY domain-containing protein [Saprospiraceae bacterium]